MSDALSQIRTRNTATGQKQPVLGRDDQVKNNAGGYVFEVSREDRVLRFLTLGTDGGTYYQKEKPHTLENAKFMIQFTKDHGVRLMDLILDVSEAGRAPRQNPALFALALVFAFGDAEAKKCARAFFNRIVRTGEHLFLFVSYARQFRGGGPALNKAIQNWYLSKDPQSLSYQLVKYRQRHDFTHRDVLRLARPKTSDPEKNALLSWAVSGDTKGFAGPLYWAAPYEAAKAIAETQRKFGTFRNAGASYARLVQENPGMSWEMLPDEALKSVTVWEALLDNGMPITALIRNLPRLTNLGLASGNALSVITSTLTNAELLRKGRVHPVRLLYALKTYAQGHGEKGKSTWTPSQRVVDAFDAAFYLAFGTIEPTGKRTNIALDLSDSMTWDVNKCGVLQAREGAVAMAMATAAVETDYTVTGFSAGSRATDYTQPGAYFRTGIEEIGISPRRRLDDNLRTVHGIPAGGTDCALPMIWAKDRNLEFDTFVIYTDNETHSGRMHPFEALRQYRQHSGINAKLIVAGMSSTGFTIADPDDPGSLDVAGFDADTPNVISGFARGDFS